MSEPLTPEEIEALRGVLFDGDYADQPIVARLLATLDAAREPGLDDASLWQWLSTLRAEHTLARGPSHGFDGIDRIGGTCAVCRGLAALQQRADAAVAQQREAAGEGR